MQDVLSNDFPKTKEEFWANKPADVSPWAWLFHPLNPFRFCLFVAKFLNKIIWYSRRWGWTIFFQRTVCKWLGITEQWLREIIRRLKLIGIIEDRKIRKNRQYRVVKSALFANPTAETRGETFGENASKNAATDTEREAYSEPPPSYMEHHDQYCRSEGTIIKPDEGKADDPIVQAFEETTGTKYQPKRDGPSLAKLRQFHPMAVIAGILISQLRVPEVKINSLAYCIPAVQEVAKAQSTPIRQEVNGKAIAHTLSAGGLMSYVRRLRQKLANLRRG